MTTQWPAIPEDALSGLPFTRLRLPARGWLFHAGQPRPGLYFVHAGYLRTSVGSDDGRERITAFPMRGDWVGLESIGSECHASDAVALDASEVWHLPESAMADATIARRFAAHCARQLREQQAWALAVGSLCAERRVLAFLQDQARRHAELGLQSNALHLAHDARGDGQLPRIADRNGHARAGQAASRRTGAHRSSRRHAARGGFAQPWRETAPPQPRAVRRS
jgi:CRP-like cAMP-binding protein